MNLLAPAFLLGLAAVVVPILIHLRHRERRDAIRFPSLMFLQRIPFRSVRRQKLRHLLLLALRGAALVLLALAFARPLLDTSRAAALPVQGARAQVVLLDTSYSMAYGDRWSRAAAAARSEIDSLTAEDSGALVPFSDRVEGAVGLTGDKATLLAAVDAVRPGSRGTRFAPALKLAQEWLDAAQQPRREVVLVSDFQKVGWSGNEDVHLPAGASFRPVTVAGGETDNVALTGLSLQRDFAGGRERVAASVRLASKGRQAAGDVAVTLELGGRAVEEKRASVAAVAASTLGFEAFAFPVGVTRGTIRTAGDALPADDVLHFVLAPGQAVPVLIVPADGAPDAASVYLTGALAIGDRPRFRTDVRPRASTSAADVSSRAVVILDDTPPLAAEADRALRSFVERGGGVLIVLGDRGSLGGWPGATGPAVDRTADRGATLGFLDYDHPVLALFKGPKSGDFSTPRFLRYRRYTPGEGARVLARYDDGSAALVESRVGQGRVLVFTSGLDARWNDLPLRPVFLPLIHQLVKYAAGQAEERSAWHVGDVLELAAPPASATVTVVAPSGARQRLEPGQRYLELGEAGFYEVRTSAGGRETVGTLAVNVDTAESDLTPIEPDEIAHSLARSSAASAAAPETAEERERRQAVWWYALAAVFLMLAAETLLSNRLSRAAG